MDVRDLQSPNDFVPTPWVRARVLALHPDSQGWWAQTREIEWDADGNAREVSQQRVLTDAQLKRLRQLWEAQRYVVVARFQPGESETVYYEHRDDRAQLEARNSPTIPDALEVWISANRKREFHCQVPRSLAFSGRSAERLAEQDIGYSEVEVTERRGTLTARVFWMNGQPSAETQARWQPIIERKVRAYLTTWRTQSPDVFVQGILEDSVRLGDDARDLIMAGVNLKAMNDQLKAQNYAPMAEE